MSKKLFRGCRYEVIVHVPNESLWSRHFSLREARRSFTEAANNRRGDHTAGTVVELRDVGCPDGPCLVERRTVQP